MQWFRVRSSLLKGIQACTRVGPDGSQGPPGPCQSGCELPPLLQVLPLDSVHGKVWRDIYKYFIHMPALGGGIASIAVFWLLLLLVVGLWVVLIVVLFFSVINLFLQ